MSDKPKIVAGLVVFLALVTFPLWYTRAAGGSDTPPKLEPPAGAKLFTVPWSTVASGGADETITIDAIKAAFGTKQLQLSDQATVTAGEEGNAWRIVDGTNRYLLLKNQEAAAVYTGCVQEKDAMIANHMALLIGWRDAVVREADKTPIQINGTDYLKSLTKCCMTCHTSRATFCTRCHEYANVLQIKPMQSSEKMLRGIRCWNCHLDAKGD